MDLILNLTEFLLFATLLSFLCGCLLPFGFKMFFLNNFEEETENEEENYLYEEKVGNDF